MKARYAVLISLIVALVLGGIGYAIRSASYEDGKQAERQLWEKKWSDRDGADLQATLKQEKQQREEEQRRQKQVEEIIKNAEREKQKAITDFNAANDAADKLRGTLATIRRQLANSETGRISADAARRQTAAETAILLTKLYEESDRRAGEIAEYADAAASAGKVCERAYEAVRQSVK